MCAIDKITVLWYHVAQRKWHFSLKNMCQGGKVYIQPWVFSFITHFTVFILGGIVSAVILVRIGRKYTGEKEEDAS